MASIMLSPGVDVRQKDFSDYVSESSTCTIGVVGGARKGPLTPTLITSRDQLIETFGKPSLNDYGVISTLAVLENSDKVYYQRVINNGSKAKAGIDSDLVHFVAVSTGEDYNGVTVEVTGTAEDFDLTITKSGQSPEVIEGCTTTSGTASYVLTKVNGTSLIVRAVLNTKAGATFSAKTYTLANGSEGCKKSSTGTDQPLVFTSRTYDSVINGFTVDVELSDIDSTYDVTLYEGDRIVERFDSLDSNPVSDRYLLKFINKYSKYYTVVANAEVTDSYDSGTYVFEGGTDGIDGITPADVIGTGNTGLQGFSDVEAVDIDILIVPGWSDSSVVNEAINVAANRQDCLYLIDTPFGLNPQGVIDWTNGSGDFSGYHNAFDSSYAAVYWSWLKVYDSYSGTDLWLPPSGFVASQIAFSDNASEPWFAPAGFNRGLMTTPIELEYAPNQGERDLLYGGRNIVNPIVNFKGKGITIWGQRTTQRRPSALDRVNTRRLANYLKKIIADSTAYYLFEPNDEYCWQRWVDMVEPRLEAIKSKRGIYEFKVIMDSTTVTEDDIANNRMPGTIMYKPTKTSEFIPLDFTIMPQGALFEEQL